jgi:hypothetical protein
VDHDDEARSYSYSVLEGVPGLTSPRDAPRRGGERGLAGPLAPNRHLRRPRRRIEARLRGVMTAGLESLRERLEG